MSNRWLLKWSIESFVKVGTSYTVSLGTDGNWGCSCPAWIFQRRKLPDNSCKHIHALKECVKIAGGVYSLESVTIVDKGKVIEFSVNDRASGVGYMVYYQTDTGEAIKFPVRKLDAA